jgi:hypothetical protein
MRIWVEEIGYTLIETLVAFILLFIVLVPFTHIMTFLLSDWNSREKIWATNLVEREMEITILYQRFYDEERLEKVGGKNYLLQRKIKNEGQLVKIQIEVIHPLRRTVIFNLITVRRNVIP